MFHHLWLSYIPIRQSQFKMCWLKRVYIDSIEIVYRMFLYCIWWEKFSQKYNYKYLAKW